MKGSRKEGFLPKMAPGGLMQSERPGHFGGEISREPPGRPQAFRAAARHSSMVKFFRRAIIVIAALVTILLIAASFLRSSDPPDAHLRLDRIGLSGDKVTMEKPKLTGVRRDGRPFEVTALSGVQNPRDPSRMELNALDAKLRLTDDEETRIVGDQGLYDSNAQTLLLSGHVRITSGGYDLEMNRAEMNFKTNAMSSSEAVQLTFTDGWINANSMVMSENGAQLSFIGNVQSSFRQGGVAEEPHHQPNEH